MKLSNILVVDDAKSIRLYMREILQQVDVSITEACDGDEAFELIRNNEYDTVFLDIETLGKSGIEVTKRVREQLGYLYTPIIVMTGLTQPRLVQLAFDNGATDYIKKPLCKFEILARLKTRLENRCLDRELRLTRLAAERANQEKSKLITHLAHELKTPLNAIMGFSELIQMDPYHRDVMDNCRHIYDAAKHQNDLINEVINLAQVEAGIIEMNLSKVDLFSVIKEAFMLNKPMADKFNINLNFPRRSDVSFTITTDNKRLKQVLINLISNAIKYNKPNGDVTVEVKQEFDGYIKIGIADTGSGIAKQDVPKLFEAFNRLGAETTKVEGTGIGLRITKNIVEFMGGQLQVESTVGKGSVFWVSLPSRNFNAI